MIIYVLKVGWPASMIKLGTALERGIAADMAGKSTHRAIVVAHAE
jgi:hypothetical protein